MLKCATKKKNILTLVLSEKKNLNETKNHNPPFKLNGRSLTTHTIMHTNIFNKNLHQLIQFNIDTSYRSRYQLNNCKLKIRGS